MKKVIAELLKTKFLLIAIVSIVLLGLDINEAYAGVIDMNSFVADDPDNEDVVYSIGDTFTLTFSLPINVTAGATMSQAAINGNFTLSVGAVFGTTYSGLWSGDRLTLTITVNTVGVPNPTIGVTTVSSAVTSNLGRAGFLPTSSQLTGAPTLAGDYGLSSGGGSVPKEGYQPPTMGVTRHGMVLVEDGFSYNNNPVDVTLMNTHYPLVTTKVGEENVAKLKIYSPMGIDQLQHVAMGFGLGNGQIFGDSNVVIEWDKLPNGEHTLNVIDPENYLDNVRVVTSEGKCRENGNDVCLIVEFYHTFRKPLDYNIIGTYIWDNKRSGSNNYYNDGVQIVGDSLDPPAKYQVNHRGELIQITETGKNTAIDENGNTWTLDGTWKLDYLPQGKIDDGLTSKGIERDNVKFNTYKQGQALIAQKLLQSTEDGKLIKPKTLAEPIFYEIDFTDRSKDIQLQNHIAYEKIRANQWFAEHFVVNTEGEFNRYLNIYKKFHEQNE